MHSVSRRKGGSEVPLKGQEKRVKTAESEKWYMTVYGE